MRRSRSAYSLNRLPRILLFVGCCALAMAQTGRIRAGDRGAGDLTPPLRPAGHATGYPAQAAIPTLPSGTAPTDFVELRRSRCFGACPAYTVRIQADGQVGWMGDKFVQAVGPRSKLVSPDTARPLLEKFRAAGFWSLCDRYDRGVTDVASATTVVHLGDREKSVTDRADDAPEWLRELDRQVDALADTHQWIHGDPRTERFFFNLDSDARGPKPGLTVLMQACARGDTGEVQRLLMPKPDVNAQDASGWTALIYASVAPRPEATQLLLDSGANPAISSYAGQTALMAAAVSFYEPRQKLQMLLTAGADVNAQDQDGKTALMYALGAQFGHPEVIALLLQAGARTDLRDAQGLTAKDYLEREAGRRRYQEQEAQQLRELLH